VAYINTSGKPSRRERSERSDSDVHGAGVGYFRDFHTASVLLGFRVFSYIRMLLM
jgi:hypothetical protein